MLALPLLFLLGAAQEADALRSEVSRLTAEVALLKGSLRERDALLGTVREELAGVREDLRELRDRPQPVAAPFLAAPPAGSSSIRARKHVAPGLQEKSSMASRICGVGGNCAAKP